MLDVKKKPCGPYETNCYIVCFEYGEFIVDPGMGALEWLKQEVEQPLAILNTHGHFDHIWDNQITKDYFGVPLYVPKADLFMLQDTTGINRNAPHSEPDYLIEGDEVLELFDCKIEFIHLPGHTPGTSIVVFEDAIFSGDFVFQGSIGRYDFPYSDETQMHHSLKKFQALDQSDKPIFPGHGAPTTLYKEQDNMTSWLRLVKAGE